MAEFVEQELEDLVPVLEQLQATRLLSSKEVNQLIKRCRRYDYRVHKIHENPDDFITYANYLKDLIALLKERRDAIGYEYEREIIERTIQHKIAVLYRRLPNRFKGCLDFWMQYINFAKSCRVRTTCSRDTCMHYTKRCDYAMCERIPHACIDRRAENGKGYGILDGLHSFFDYEVTVIWK